MDAEVRERLFRPLPWWAFMRRRHCAHVNVRGVYDHDTGIRSRRLVCRRCGRALDGPLQIAEDRTALTKDRLGFTVKR